MLPRSDEPLRLALEVDYQACTNDVCHAPETLRLALPLRPGVEPG